MALAFVGLVPHAGFATPFTVSSTAAWQNTGVFVNAGDLLGITATGSIRFDSAGRTADPNGDPDGDSILGLINYLVPSVQPHTLVGRIGTSGDLTDLSGFLVGSSFSQVVGSSGHLFLAFNDGFVRADRSGLDSGGVGDNDGSFLATITVTPSAVPEPATVVLMMIAGVGLAARRRGCVRT
jgi:hypothetical protein